MIRHLRQHLRDRHHERIAGQISIDAARQRARRGAAYLDAADPSWAYRINPASLELGDGAHCVLGQLHGEFRVGLLRTRIWDGSSAPNLRLFSSVSPEDLGFHARQEAGEELTALDYAFLNRAWREQILRRTRAAQVVAPATGAPIPA